MIITDKHFKADISELTPLTTETKNTLSKYIFDGPLQGGCKDMQIFAKKIDTLKALQSQLDKGEIDLGKRDRMIAVAKCVGAALLTIAAAMGAIFLFPIVGVSAGYGPGLLMLPFSAAAGLFYVTCLDASKVFQGPSSEQVRKELSKPYNEIPLQDLQNIQNVLQKLEDIQNSCSLEIENAKELGAVKQEAFQNAKRAELLAAHADLSKMLKALTNPAIA